MSSVSDFIAQQTAQAPEGKPIAPPKKIGRTVLLERLDIEKYEKVCQVTGLKKVEFLSTLTSLAINDAFNQMVAKGHIDASSVTGFNLSTDEEEEGDKRGKRGGRKGTSTAEPAAGEPPSGSQGVPPPPPPSE